MVYHSTSRSPLARDVVREAVRYYLKPSSSDILIA